MDRIKIVGARQHNLKNVDLAIPRRSLVVITGLSGSGKSSLAFDTIFAEGQRRYMESLSNYARQFVEKLDKPDVDSIEGLSPSVAVDQRSFQRNPRSTVGTVTEVYDFLRLLFSRVGTPYCYRCGVEIVSQSVEAMVDRVRASASGGVAAVFAPVVRGRRGEHRRELEELRAQGFVKLRVDGELRDLDDDIRLAKGKRHTIEVLVDTVPLGGSGEAERLAESLRLALRMAGGVVRVEVEGAGEMVFSEKLSCTSCGMGYPELTPRIFSFNSPYGACAECDGLGVREYFDRELLVEDWDRSIDEGAIAITRGSDYFRRVVDDVCDHFGIDRTVPLRRLPRRHVDVIMDGAGDELVTFRIRRGGGVYTYRERYPGLVGLLAEWYENTDSAEVRSGLEKFIRRSPCPACEGTRLRPEARSVLVGGRSIADLAKMDVAELAAFVGSLHLEGTRGEVASRITKEIASRLRFLEDVGLGYLTLDRPAPTLSGGEAQRIRLATQVGSRLTGVTYVLDEPTIGLHPRDNERLLGTLRALKKSGNTILVVEHDEYTIRNADYVVDMGPRAGEHGGRVVAAGTVEDVMACRRSLTGDYLAGRRLIEVPSRRAAPRGCVRVKGAAENNLKSIDVDFPLGVLTCVTGVSGSGKSTLVVDILYAALAARLHGYRGRVGRHRAIEGLDLVDKVVAVDQNPIGRTLRSNPATYTGVFSHIRELFAMLPEARMKGYGPGRFSFNVDAGRCDVCRGEGVVKIEMHFLPDVYVECEQCGGMRYNDETLRVRYKGRNIADVLRMTVAEAVEFFAGIPAVRERLAVLERVGLGYVRLGQPATTLSGGESQRIKLARELAKRSTGRTLYVLDEPTIGLHFEDVRRLLEVLFMLRDRGNTVVVIEHNIDVIKSADYVIDLGPEGGDEGGRLVAAGTPEEVAQVEGSHTARFLRGSLGMA